MNLPCSLKRLTLSSSIFLLAFNQNTPKKLTISVDSDLNKVLAHRFDKSFVALKKGDKISTYSVEEKDLPLLSHIMHKKFGRCGGFMIEDDSKVDPNLIFFEQHKTANSFNEPQEVESKIIQKALAEVSEQSIRDTIKSMSNFQNRYYRSEHGKNSQNWLASHWQKITSNDVNISVEKFEHNSWPQDSVILSWRGNKRPNEIIVIGGHGDSIISWGRSPEMRAPGADDNASGIAAITEMIRSLVAIGFKPERTIKFMSYAAEEVGLRGSSEIARSYSQDNIDVRGVIQLDMTNYSRRKNEIVFISDYTNARQNSYLKKLAAKHLPELSVYNDKCGYACSDHVSWHRNNFPVSFPFEARFSEYNHNIHSHGDTISKSNNRANHATKFAKLVLAYIMEMSQSN